MTHDQEGLEDGDRLACMKSKEAETVKKLVGASNSIG